MELIKDNEKTFSLAILEICKNMEQMSSRFFNGQVAISVLKRSFVKGIIELLQAYRNYYEG